jgi:hypothetical protein
MIGASAPQVKVSSRMDRMLRTNHAMEVAYPGEFSTATRPLEVRVR